MKAWLTRKPVVLVVSGVILFAAGVIAADLWNSHQSGQPFTVNPDDADCLKQYALTSQLLDCATYDTSAAQLGALDTNLDGVVALYLNENRATKISIWVRDLTSKQFASTNELDTFAPASLLKLPLAIAFYKFSEVQPSILSQSIVYATPSQLDERYNYFTASTSLVVGHSYTVEDLLDRMVTNSDNGAYYTLLGHIGSDYYDQVMLDLGIQIPSNNNVIDFITAKSYSNLFRMLYNSSYLSRTDSEHLLELMSRSNFQGIRTPLPQPITVADKFGERSVYDQNGNAVTKELHDCGIVYKQPDPYAICIMTEGADFNQLQSVIQDLSKFVYNSVP